MSIIGIEEIFLAVNNMEKSIEFYNGILGIPIDKQDSERTYLQTERGHIVLQIINHTGRHNGGGPLHFAFTVTEDSFDVWGDTVNIAARLESSGEQGKIHISEKTSNYLGEKGIVTPRGEINLKNKGSWKTFFLDNLI